MHARSHFCPSQLRLFERLEFVGVMIMLDSAAVFEAGCREMGLLPDEAARLKSKGWNSFALMAFACSYTPGQSDDSKPFWLKPFMLKSRMRHQCL